MRPVTTLFTTPHGRQRHVGWFAPMLETARTSAGRSTTSSEFVQRCDEYIAPRASAWMNAAGWHPTEAGWNLKLGQILVYWMRHLQLLEAESTEPTETGEAWLSGWNRGQEGIGPLAMVGGARRLLTTSILLAGDGPMLLAVLDSLSLQECSLQQLARASMDKLAQMPLPSSVSRALPEVNAKLRTASDDASKASDALACRVFPLIELGLVVRPKLGAYALTLKGHHLSPEVHAWCANEQVLASPHRRIARRLAFATLDEASLTHVSLVDRLPELLERIGQRTWKARRQWPLWESLLLASAETAALEQPGFELEEGLKALDEFRIRVPGGLEWVSGRRVDQQYFRLHLERLTPSPNIAGRPEVSNTPVSNTQETEVASEQAISDVAEPASDVDSSGIPSSSTPASADSRDPATASPPTASRDEVQARPADPVPLWLLDVIEDELLREEDRPESLPLHGCLSALRHLQVKLEGLENESEDEHDLRFWSRLDNSNDLVKRFEHHLAPKQKDKETLFHHPGLYEGLLFRIEHALKSWTYGDDHSTTMLRRQLEQHKKEGGKKEEGKKEGGQTERLFMARLRVETALHDWESILVEQLYSWIQTASAADALDAARLLMRDTLLEEGLDRTTLSGLFEMPNPTSSLKILLDQSILRGVSSAYRVSMEATIPNPLHDSIIESASETASESANEQAEARQRAGTSHRSLFVRQNSSSLQEELEISVVGTAGQRRPLVPSHQEPSSAATGRVIANAMVWARSKREAGLRAERWLSERLAAWQLSLLGFEEPRRAALGVSVRDVELDTDLSTISDSTNQVIVSLPNSRLALWRPPVAPKIFRLIVNREMTPALERSIAAWNRARNSENPLSRFADLWTGLEHLLAPTQGLDFTRRLARVLVLPMLRRRGAALSREIAQRLLRAIKRPVSTELPEARHLHLLIQEVCIEPNVQQQLTSQLDLSVETETLRSDPWLARYSLPSTRSAFSFAKALQGLSEDRQAELIAAVKKHAPTLSPALERWRDAVKSNKGILELAAHEYMQLMAQVGYCYDLRNRIQHEGDHFPGKGQVLLQEAAEYVSAWTHVVLEQWLMLEDAPNEPTVRRMRRLQLPLDDLLLAIEGRSGRALNKKPSESDLRRILIP